MIKYHIPDFVRHMKLNFLLSETMKQYPDYFYPDIKIGSVYGTFPTAMWNGGRSFSGNMDRRYMQQIMKLFNQRGIPIRFTFSNPMIVKEHLNDEFCNFLLKMAYNGLNEVIVMSPILEEYIRKNYPDYKIISSTCKQIEDTGMLTSELEKNYSLVVLDYNWNNNFEFLEKIKDKEKCELLINPYCTPHCKRRKEHYEFIGKQQIAMAEHMQHFPNMPMHTEEFVCPQMQLQFYQTTDLSVHIKPSDLYNKYAPMGFENFKIEGRQLPDVSVLESYIYYMVKPEYKDFLRQHILIKLLSPHQYFNEN